MVNINRAQASILLIEDYQRLGSTLIHLLQRLPVHLTLATDASDAIECLNQEQYDLVILDLQDPEFDKFTTLLQVDHTPSCPEFFDLSDRIKKDDLHKTLHCQTVTQLPKPFEPDYMLLMVEKVFEK